MVNVELSSDDLYRSVGDRIRLARSVKGKSQEWLGKIIGIGRTSVTNIERGKQKLNLETLFKMAIALEVNVAELLPSVDEIRIDRYHVARDETLSTDEEEWVAGIIQKSTESDE